MVESWFNPFPKIETSRQKPGLALHSIFGRKNMCGVYVLHQGVAATWCNITNQDEDDSRWCAGAIKDSGLKKKPCRKSPGKNHERLGYNSQIGSWMIFFSLKNTPETPALCGCAAAGQSKGAGRCETRRATASIPYFLLMVTTGLRPCVIMQRHGWTNMEKTWNCWNVQLDL